MWLVSDWFDRVTTLVCLLSIAGLLGLLAYDAVRVKGPCDHTELELTRRAMARVIDERNHLLKFGCRP